MSGRKGSKSFRKIRQTPRKINNMGVNKSISPKKHPLENLFIGQKSGVNRRKTPVGKVTKLIT